MPKTSKTDWAAASRIASRQHGLITNEQLAGCGCTPKAVRIAVESGRLIAQHPGVYRSTAMARSIEQLLHAATLRAGPPAAASHRSAAHIWDLVPRVDRPEITIPQAARAAPKGVIVHRSADLDPNHFTTRRGIRVTKPARTLVDLAAVLDQPALAEVVDRVLVRELVSQLGLRTIISELARPGRKGPAALRRALDDHSLGGRRPESVIEPVMAAIVRRSPVAGLIVYQQVVVIGGQKCRLDFAAPSVKAGFEVLGLHEHGARQAVIDDSRRRRLLRLEGWELLEFTMADMRRPSSVANEITRFVQDRQRFFRAMGLLA